VADVELAGILFAPHYARAQPRDCIVPSVMLRAAADEAAEAVSQLLHGEGFAVLDIAGGWAWGYCLHDHYVGYLPADALGDAREPSHVVTVPEALLFSAPDIKSPVRVIWPIGACFAGVENGSFVACDEGYLHRRHVAPLGEVREDFTKVAESLSGLPYLWGGRGAGGIDCSGLIQVALARAGVAAPRDTDQQRTSLGRELGAKEPLRRGDIIFFPGHAGLMADTQRLIHANAYTMGVTIEPLADFVARLSPNHDKPVLARRRIEL
jgi:hypothetical protein